MTDKLPIKVYVAGAYSADNVLDVLHNMRRGMNLSTECFVRKFAPFSPWLDYHFLLQVREEEAASITVEDFYQYSLAWLAVSDAVLVVENSEQSIGTQKEIEFARSLGIPIFHDILHLQQWRERLYDQSGGQG